MSQQSEKSKKNTTNIEIEQGSRLEKKAREITIKIKTLSSVEELDRMSNAIKAICERCSSKAVGPVNLPVDFEKFDVKRSPHVNAKSVESFQRIRRSRLIRALNPTEEFFEEIAKMEGSVGISFEIKAS